MCESPGVGGRKWVSSSESSCDEHVYSSALIVRLHGWELAGVG